MTYVLHRHQINIAAESREEKKKKQTNMKQTITNPFDLYK